MGLPIVGDLIDAVGGLVGKAIVDKDKKNELKFKLQELRDRADERLHEELMAQTEINKTEAQHSSIFVAGWRPFIGWVGGVGLGYTFVLSPFIETIAKFFGYVGDMPVLDSGQLMALVTSMLGVAGYRTFEKVKGVERSALN